MKRRQCPRGKRGRRGAPGSPGEDGRSGRDGEAGRSEGDVWWDSQRGQGVPGVSAGSPWTQRDAGVLGRPGPARRTRPGWLPRPLQTRQTRTTRQLRRNTELPVSVASAASKGLMSSTSRERRGDGGWVSYCLAKNCFNSDQGAKGRGEFEARAVSPEVVDDLAITGLLAISDHWGTDVNRRKLSSC